MWQAKAIISAWVHARRHLVRKVMGIAMALDYGCIVPDFVLFHRNSPSYGPMTAGSRTMKFIRINDVKAATGLARSTIYKYVKQGMFPAPVPLGCRAVAWVEGEVTAWIAARIRERDQQVPPQG